MDFHGVVDFYNEGMGMEADSLRQSEGETIVAISTPPGRGGIGIVRLSGALSLAIAEGLVALRAPLEPGRARLADVVDGDSRAGEGIAARMDEALVTWFAGPHSYTGEDVVEIAAHGSPVVLEALVRGAVRAGARLAEAGEFTQRAFLSGRMDLTQAEAVRDLIEAQTLAQARLAASQMGGALSQRVGPTKHALLELIALLEAGIDFAEDDLEVAQEGEILRRLRGVAEPLTALEATFRHGRVVHDGLTMAIVGRPNAGKSSLFNALVERERAIVTATPGTTRDLVTERIALGGIPLELVDTAGLREAGDEVERLGIERSRRALADAELVLVVVDGAAGMHGDDLEVIRALQGRAALVAWNKSDLVAEEQTPATLDEAIRVVATSAVTGAGVAELRGAIVELATGGAAAETGMLTSLRHHQAVTTAIAALGDAETALRTSIPHEMVLLDIYRALWALDALTGQTTPDDVLNLIFSRFCIGK